MHALLDGRDTPPRSALGFVRDLEARLAASHPDARVASVGGRYFAMDRDKRWDRVASAWGALVKGEGFKAASGVKAAEEAYARGETDEFVKATAIAPEGAEPACVKDGDVVIFMNYRSDRARQITRPFIEPGFDAFERQFKPKLGSFVSLTEYSADYRNPVAFPPERTADRRAGVRRVKGGVKYRKGRVIQVHRTSPVYTRSISRPAYSQE